MCALFLSFSISSAHFNHSIFLFHNIDRRLFVRRISLGWSVKEALSPHHKTTGKECYDHLGRKYSSLCEMCRVYGLNFGTFKGRRSRDWDIEDTLTRITSFECTDHLGNKYNSLAEMCNHYCITSNISPGVILPLF